MPESVAPNPQADADRLEAAADQAITGLRRQRARRRQGIDRGERVSGIGSLRINACRFACLHARTVQNLFRLTEG
jgi:hypothetical protein